MQEKPSEWHDTLWRAANSKNHALVYIPYARDFGIYRPTYDSTVVPLSPLVATASKCVEAFMIDFCPWSGASLPISLYDEWRHLAPRASGLTPILQDDDDKSEPPEEYFEFGENCRNLLPEFHSDEWWRNRNILRGNRILEPTWKKPPLLDGIIAEEDDPLPDDHEWPQGLSLSGCSFGPGFCRFRGRPPHFCAAMAAVFKNFQSMIAYLPWTREYGVRILRVGRKVAKQSMRIEPISYCPWCGDALPASLRSDWLSELKRRGLTGQPAGVDALPPPHTPTELRSEDWWRARDLVERGIAPPKPYGPGNWPPVREEERWTVQRMLLNLF